MFQLSHSIVPMLHGEVHPFSLHLHHCFPIFSTSFSISSHHSSFSDMFPMGFYHVSNGFLTMFSIVFTIFSMVFTMFCKLFFHFPSLFPAFLRHFCPILTPPRGVAPVDRASSLSCAASLRSLEATEWRKAFSTQLLGSVG